MSMQISQKEIGARLKDYRTMQGVSQSMISKEVGCDRTSISHWESGKHEMILVHFLRYLDALGVSMCEFFGDDRPMRIVRIHAGREVVIRTEDTDFVIKGDRR